VEVVDAPFPDDEEEDDDIAAACAAAAAAAAAAALLLLFGRGEVSGEEKGTTEAEFLPPPLDFREGLLLLFFRQLSMSGGKSLAGSASTNQGKPRSYHRLPSITSSGSLRSAMA